MRINLECPVELLDYQLYKSKSSGKIYCSLTFNNVADKIVKGLKTTIYCFDQFGEPVNGKENHFECKVEFKEGLNRNQRLEADEKVSLLDFKDTRKIEVDITKVLFADQTIWEKGTSQLEKVELKEIEDLKLLGFVKSRAGKEAKYYATKYDERWSCVCGRLNYDYQPTCKRCGRGRDDVLTEFSDEEKLRRDLLAYEEEKAEKQRIAEEERKQQLEINKQKARKLVKYVSIIAASILIIIVTTFGFITKFTFSLENYRLLKDKDNALIQAVKDDDVGSVKFLVNNGANVNFVNKEGEMPLTESIKHGHLEIADILIEYGTETENIGNEKETILHLAVRYDQLELLKHFINSGFDTELTNGQDLNVFEFSLLNGKMAVVDYFATEEVFDLHSVDSLGRNAIHLLAKVKKDPELLFDYFIKHEISAEAFDKEGYSPLYFAIKENNKKLIDLLLQYGVDTEKVTKDGQSAFDVATLLQAELIDMFNPLLLEVKIDKQAKNINIGGVTLGTKKQEVIDLWGEPNESVKEQGLNYDSFYVYNLKSKYGEEKLSIFFYKDKVDSITFESSYNIDKTAWYKDLGKPYEEEGTYYQAPWHLFFINEDKKGGTVVTVDNNFWVWNGTTADYLNYLKSHAQYGYVDLLVKDVTEQEVINILGEPDFGGEYGAGTYIAYIVGEYALYFGVPFFGVKPSGSESYFVDEIWVSKN